MDNKLFYVILAIALIAITFLSIDQLFGYYDTINGSVYNKHVVVTKDENGFSNTIYVVFVKTE